MKGTDTAMSRQRNRYVIVGLGGFGAWTAIALHDEGHEVIAMDRKGALVDRAATYVDVAVVGDGTDREFLREIGADSADAAIICTGDDLASSILSIVAFKDLGVADIYVKVNSLEAARAVQAFRVNESIFPEREAANRLAHRITRKAVLDYVPVGGGCSIQEIAVPDAWLGKSLSELSLPSKHGITVVALRDLLEGTVTVVPDPHRLLTDSDVIVVAGRDETVSGLLSQRAAGR